MAGIRAETAEVVVKSASAVDAAAMAAWINRYHWNPGTLGGAPVSGSDYATFIAERGGVETFLALAGERIVGSLALYPVSAMKGGRGAAVWMDTFAIDPEFRRGIVPIQLFIEAFTFCIRCGYDRVDCNASPGNPSMVAIVRPGGFRQASAQPCGDDRLEFRSYLPLVYRYIIEALGMGDRLTELAKAWTDLGSAPWLPGRVPPQNPDGDTLDYYGAPTLRYAMLGSGVESGFTVDLVHDRVCSLSWATLDVEFHPAVSGRQATTGQPATFIYRIANRGTEPVTTVVSLGRQGESARLKAHQVVVPAGAEVNGKGGLDVGDAGDTEAELTVRTTVLHEGRPHPATLTLHSWVHAVQRRPPTTVAPVSPHGRRPRFEEHADHWLVVNPWIRMTVDKVTGTCELEPRAGSGPGIRELWPDVGPPYPAALKTPPCRQITCVDVADDDGEVTLTLRSAANVWWQRHATAYAERKYRDLGLAQAVLQRSLIVGGDQVVALRTTLLNATPELLTAVGAGECLLSLHPWARGHSLTMSLPLKSGLLRAPVIYERFPFGMHSLDLRGSADLPSDPDAYDEEWTAFTDDNGNSVGLIWQAAREIRFGLQWMPALLLAADPAEPPAMPGGTATFPHYAFFCGPGDERSVRAAWSVQTDTAERLMAATRPPVSAPVPVQISVCPVAPVEPDGHAIRLSGRVTALSVRGRYGRLTARAGDDAPTVQLAETTAERAVGFPFAGHVEVPDGADGPLHVSVTWSEELAEQSARYAVLPVRREAAPVSVREEGDVWHLGNGLLQARVAPDFGGSVISLRRGNTELLRSTYPVVRPLGIVLRARGGLNVSVVGRRADPRISVAQELFAWTLADVQPAELPAAGLTWTGVRLVGKGDFGGSPADVTIDYLMVSGAPALLVLTRISRDAGFVGLPAEVCVAAHADAGTEWTFRGLREGHEFEYRPVPHGSNRPVAGSRGLGALVSGTRPGEQRRTLAVAGPADAEVLGFKDQDDWSIRVLTPIRPQAEGIAVSATCLAALDTTSLVSAQVLSRIAESARSAAIKAE